MTTYIIKSILCSGIFLLIYHLFLEQEKMHRFNRFYLLLSIAFAFSIPLLSVEMAADVAPQLTKNPAILLGSSENVSIIQSEPSYETVEKKMLTDKWPFFLYGAICFLLLIRFYRNFRSVLARKQNQEFIHFQGATLILVPENIVTYTFIDNIFVTKSAYQQNQIEDEVLAHELTHARQKHTLDILFIELFTCIFWINPLLLLYKRAIQLNHEFLADEAVLNKYQDRNKYKLILLDKILSGRQVNLTSSFNYSVTKKRLIMMNKTKNLARGIFKQSLTACLTLGIAFLFCEKIYSQNEKISTLTNQTKKVYGEKPGSGLSTEEMNDFKNTIENHTRYITNRKGRTDPIVTMPPEIEDQMFELYTRMSAEQRKKQTEDGYMLFKMGIPVKKAPTPEMFENWKKPTIFGVWINNKHVPNTELDKYKFSDIAEYDLSKLYGGALKGRIYKYQLNLLTNDYFDRTYEKRAKDRVIITRVGFFKDPSKN